MEEKTIKTKITHRSKRWITLILGLAMLVAAAGSVTWFVNTRAFKDQVVSWQHPLNSKVAALAHEAGLNANGNYLLQISQAEVLNRSDFTQVIPQAEQAAVLGLYMPKTKRIYVFNVTDPQISTITTVTAAHEMLHAAYDRLPPLERATIDAEIRAYIPKIKNPEIISQLNIYEQTEPGQEINELHSLLGTEEKDLPAGLESYYKTYFADRSKVLAAYDKYSTVFTDLRDKITKLQDTMLVQKAAIDSDKANYEAQIQQFNAAVDSFNAQANTLGGFASEGDFEAARSALLAQQQSLVDFQNQINSEIDNYNQEVAQLKALGGEANTLNSAIGAPPLPVN
jgi:hypothetical protein